MVSAGIMVELESPVVGSVAPINLPFSISFKGIVQYCFGIEGVDSSFTESTPAFSHCHGLLPSDLEKFYE